MLDKGFSSAQKYLKNLHKLCNNDVKGLIFVENFGAEVTISLSPVWRLICGEWISSVAFAMKDF